MIRRLFFRNVTRNIAWTCAIAMIALGWPSETFAAEMRESGYTQFAAADSSESYADTPAYLTAHTAQPAIIAQAVTPAQTPTQTPIPTPRPTLVAPIGLISPTLSITPTATVTATGTNGDQAPARRTTVVTTQQIPALNSTATPIPADALEDTEAEIVEEALEGTIVANRSNHTARFFIEGETIELGATRATSFDLPRATTVLNLYNCAASTPESNADCYWDPYVLQRDGFYEIYQNRPAGVNTVARLMLRTADAPPTDQVWVQNRTSGVESIVYRNEAVELAPTAVEEFAVDPGLPAILYVRSCITLQGQSACEWSPKTLEAGIYYALTEIVVAGGLANSTITNVDLRPVVGASGEVMVEPEEVLCRVQVPALNIRSGPGLQYQIIGKVFSSESDPGEVMVVGRNDDSQWIVVDPAVMPNGWVTASESFIVCQGEISALPLVEAPPLPVAPAPAPVVVAPEQPAAPAQTPSASPDPDGGDGAATGEPADEPGDEPGDGPGDEPVETPLPADAPAGYSALMLHNGFEHVIRFTIDQQYRPEVGPSEIDLQPGQSSRVVVFPGSITFSVSSPWGGGLSGNALINVEPDVTQPLWLRFVTDNPSGPASAWRLIWE